ncbi:restriction endonuclease subunit S [Pseudoalteromonas sp. APC 3358]|uniref:restriction endonuclease subunit S n=1 Tax=Pseudoalteromonas sp. APC 3358 TaxID=3035176 RepID=UPI0025B29D7C|nr:restriction endonuclease subunit S [Pseudoalteromonas sp. APC 3358]MDN3381937.1 restriction endonuclease subunit S [Pseudoalteromonas sp. APC 3358]
MTDSKTNINAESLSSEQLITEHLDIWTTAIEQKSSSGRGSSKKFSLHGIKKLRELILELAVRGKLVPQDPNDEPASVLLERIAAEKTQLVKDKKIKKPKALPEISEDEKPFELPKGWEWVRLQSLVTLLGDGLHGTPVYDEKGMYFFVNGNNLLDGVLTIKPETKRVSDSEYKKYKKDLGDRTVLVSINGTLGNVAFYNNEPVMLGKSACYFNLCSGLEKLFFKRLIESPYFREYAFSKASGSTIKNLGLKAMNLFPIAIPSELEQRRIVAKVDELMSLCDELEAQTENSITAHQTLVEVLLEALLKAPDQGATPEQSTAQFQQNWQRLSEHFDTLFTTTASIDTLKKTILQLAVMGKLVPQNPNDEPAAKLLERIAAEKAQLIKDKKIKKQKPLPEITDEEKPFELPEGWEWVTLSHIGLFTGGKTPSKANSQYWNGDIPWVTPKDMKVEEIFDSEDHVTRLAITNGLAEIAPESLLFVARSGILRRKFPVAITKSICTVNQDLKVLSLIDKSIVDYILLMMKGFEAYILKNLTKMGTTVESLRFDDFSKHYFIIPPLEEQHRIVAKVDELMALCEQLKARLTDAQTTKLHLTDGIVEQAL